jgi:peptide/nickel transport system substrate-binding protein
MTERDEFEQLFRDFVAGKLSRRHLLAGGAAMGAGAALAAAGGASAEPSSTARGLSRAFQDASPTPKTGGTLKVGMQSDPGGLDAVLLPGTALWHVVEHIYNKLTFIKPDLSVGLELADSLDVSDDGITYTFALHPGIKFHNGRDMVADDVVYSFKRLADPATASPSVDYVASMADIAAPDPSTVLITLKAPDASFLSQIANLACAVVPKEVVEENGDLSQVAVGTGPFKFIEYVPNTSISLEKNADYWEEGLPYVDAIEMLIASEDTSRTTAVVEGSVDLIEYAPLRDVDALQQDSSLVLAGDTNTNIRFLQFNLRRDPFTDVKVRKAISMVIDRDAVLGPAVFGHGTPVVTMWPPDHWAALQVDMPAPDIDGAKALLAEAGFADGFDTTLTSWAEYSFLSAPATVIQEQLKQIGINAELNLLDTGTMLQDVHTPGKENYDMAVTGTSGHIDPNELAQNFQTGAGGNTSGYSNPRVDELITQGYQTTDQAARVEIYHELQQILLEDLPWVNLFVANQYEAMKTYVMGYYHTPNGSNIAFKRTWLDK